MSTLVPRRLAWLLSAAAALTAALCTGFAAAAEPRRELAVCSDPHNLPFSDDKLQGFENKVAALIAEDLGASLRYAWSVQRRGFLRRTLQARRCDLVMGVPASGLPGVSATRPYYASTYAFVSLRERRLELGNFDAPALARLRIGLHAIGAEGINTPPARALASRGMVENVVGFAVWGDESESDPQAKVIDAVVAGQIDTAIVWGPFAGYFAKRHGDRLAVVPAASDPRLPGLAFAYDISLGVREGEEKLKTELQDVLDRRSEDIRAILLEYGIPLVATQSVTPPLRAASAKDR